MKKVSFVMPTWNREEYLAEAIESCLNQIYKNIEIVVVDDGSTDGTETLMKYFTDKYKNIKYINLGTNEGISFARNIGIANSTGDYIAVMDSDDVCSPDRVKKQMKVMKDKDFVYTDYMVGDTNGDIRGTVMAPAKFTKEGIISNKSIPHVTIIAKRKCFMDNPYRNELQANDDKALLVDWFNAGYGGVRLKEPTMVVRIHEGNTSKKKNKYIQEINAELNNELA